MRKNSVKKWLLIISSLSFLLAGCGSSNQTTSVSASVTPTPTIVPEDTSESPVIEMYSDSYVSFEYDSNLFLVSPSSDNLTLTLECPSMPAVPEGIRNTAIGFVTQKNDSISDFSEDEAQELLERLPKVVCQGLFELNDDEYIISENSNCSDYISEYCMEISDGSICYTKVLNYNTYISMVVLRICEYSKDYNDAFMNIYDSAKSEFGNHNFAASSADTTIIESPTQTSTTTATQEPTINEEAAVPTDTPASPEPTTNNSSSNVTTEQKNALSQAKNYLRISAFSYQGLIEQLEYEGYSHDSAVYAVDTCGADWNEQALNKAKSYLDISAFSYQGLIEQLEFEGFTNEQAVYGADNCGADWNEQAAKKAASYLSISSFSRSELISQLKYEGFTDEQSTYGVEANGY